MNHSIAYERDEKGVKSVTCSCGWEFSRVSKPHLFLKQRPSHAEFDTAIMDHERKVHKKWRADQ